jgi:hypothetical protein
MILSHRNVFDFDSVATEYTHRYIDFLQRDTWIKFVGATQSEALRYPGDHTTMPNRGMSVELLWGHVGGTAWIEHPPDWNPQ